MQITGNVNYSITLDPTVWIFDDRKILFEDAFSTQPKKKRENDLTKVADRWNQDVYQQKIKPPVNKSINRFEKEKILKNSYVMPINDFLAHAELQSKAKDVTLKTTKGDVTIPLSDFQDCYLLFAVKGKPIQEDGPVHIYFKDGSNKNNPIKGVQKVIIN